MLKEKILQQIIRVNHAGEFGALNIYQSQMNFFKNDKETRVILDAMKEQERVHLDFFAKQLLLHNIAPTKFILIWKYASKLIGICTGMLGKDTVMLCTIAVEEVIEEHYEEQKILIDKFFPNDIDMQLLKDNISIFQAEEVEHRTYSEENCQTNNIMKLPLIILIKLFCKIAISLSKYL